MEPSKAGYRLNMQVGDLVLFDEEDYPQYAGKTGVITEERRVDSFVVHVNGKEHPFFVHETALEVISASR